ncbi:MFS transporter [Xenorhabdus sp. PB62.4]|nr:MFS transporter [Xenorhabdus sp. PB62.4]
MTIYSSAFSVLTYTLMGITLLAVAICFFTLRNGRIAINTNVAT